MDSSVLLFYSQSHVFVCSGRETVDGIYVYGDARKIYVFCAYLRRTMRATMSTNVALRVKTCKCSCYVIYAQLCATVRNCA